MAPSKIGSNYCTNPVGKTGGVPGLQAATSMAACKTSPAKNFNRPEMR